MAYTDQCIQGLMQAFDAPWPGPRGKFYTIKNNDLELTVYPEDGARITSLKYKNVELLRPYTKERKAFQYGCFPMVPWVGRMKNGDITNGEETFHLYQNKGPNAMHGMAHFDTWQVDNISQTEISLSLNISTPWPWPCKVVQTLKLDNNKLALALKISTKHGKFPVDAGWHPWFLKDPDHTGCNNLNVEFHADSMEEIIDELPTTKKLAIKAGPYDDCFNYNNYNANAVLTYKSGRKITITSNCPALIIFDKQNDATCVNPMTGVPNGVNTNPHYITPITPLVAKALLTFE